MCCVSVHLIRRKVKYSFIFAVITCFGSQWGSISEGKRCCVCKVHTLKRIREIYIKRVGDGNGWGELRGAEISFHCLILQSGLWSSEREQLKRCLNFVGDLMKYSEWRFWAQQAKSHHEDYMADVWHYFGDLKCNLSLLKKKSKIINIKNK